MNRSSVNAPALTAYRGARAGRKGDGAHGRRATACGAPPLIQALPLPRGEAGIRACCGGRVGVATQEDGLSPLQSSGTARPGFAPPVLPCGEIFLRRFGDPFRIQAEARPGSDSPVLPCRHPPGRPAGAPRKAPDEVDEAEKGADEVLGHAAKTDSSVATRRDPPADAARGGGGGEHSGATRGYTPAAARLAAAGSSIRPAWQVRLRLAAAAAANTAARRGYTPAAARFAAAGSSIGTAPGGGRRGVADAPRPPPAPHGVNPSPWDGLRPECRLGA